jgi:MbtH protein
MWDDEGTTFEVVVNEEGQYSIWPQTLAQPNGWRAVGQSGPKADCLAFIEQTWTDMRPLSLAQAEARP